MDIAPVYELRTRLRAAMIAGTNLLSEDFRLKKAAEGFSALSAASPVFTKINAMTEKLLSDNSPESLLDTITLVDAVITTLGTSEVKGELEALPDNGNSSVIVNAPYSQLSTVLDALTTSGGGQYNAFMEVKNNNPELLNDYRVKSALVKGLGASYAELAAEVAHTLMNMGKEMLPLLKRDFDPNGKKEMLMRVRVIENLGGAEENDFYLEQLENAEKDVRKALIYALRHDEGNIDKLIELTKTEKGKAKTAALYALASFDSEKAAAFIEEYAKKKPVEVIELMEQVSSEWSSKLTARLIDELLVDDKGNKITLSQAANIDKVKLKSKTDFWHLNSAMFGKFGADIEKLYREFDNKDRIIPMDVRLGDAILETGDESLKALALELNAKSKMKGQYIYSEAIVRLLGNEDCSKWFEEQIRAIYKKELLGSAAIFNTPIIKAIMLIELKDGKFVLTQKHYNSITEQWLPTVFIPAEYPIRESLIDIFIKYPTVQFDGKIASWADPEDKECCKKLTDVFIEHALSKTFGSAVSLTYLSKFGVSNIKGLALKYCKYHHDYNKWAFQGFFNVLPGDNEYKLAEAHEVIELWRSGKLKTIMSENDINNFAEWAETRFA